MRSTLGAAAAASLFLFLVAPAASAADPAPADPAAMTAKQLNDACAAQLGKGAGGAATLGEGTCHDYMVRYFLAAKATAAQESAAPAKHYCISGEHGYAEIASEVVGYAKQNPGAVNDGPGSVLMDEAMHEAYPCPTGAP